MPVLNYRIEQNIAGCHEFLEKLKVWCSDQGWTILDWRKNNCAWASIGGGQYGFVGSHCKILVIRRS